MQRKRPIEIPSCKDCKGRSKSKLFCNLSANELDKLSEEKGDNFYKKGQVIFYEGNRGHGLYCIHEGKVKVHKLGDEAKEQIIRLANKGEVLGYRSLLSNEPYNATATALEDCVICYLPRSKFMELLGSNNDLSFKTISLLTDDLRNSEDKIISITQKTVIERITEAILVLKEKFGLDDDGKTLSVTLTRREIGNIAGVTTETTIRTLSDLKKSGIINLNGKQIEILNLAKLTRLSNIVN
ncbi:MAG: Crp/Fnr family transcriptional regulator [Bacteroidetes bacterium]|nr:Crp/Fnr family transcriptional regulator [Flavobacteriales bacterium]NOG58558.1 Crp/Fnr family transcriptional regulator [Bacteroidota bacterium]